MQKKILKYYVILKNMILSFEPILKSLIKKKILILQTKIFTLTK